MLFIALSARNRPSRLLLCSTSRYIAIDRTVPSFAGPTILARNIAGQNSDGRTVPLEHRRRAILHMGGTVVAAPSLSACPCAPVG